MRIAFVGKGGSGKTTLSSIFARFLAGKKLNVLAIDADINQNMGGVLGLDEDQLQNIPPMGIEISKIKDFVRGTNPKIASQSEFIKTTPPGNGSILFNMKQPNQSLTTLSVSAPKV